MHSRDYTAVEDDDGLFGKTIKEGDTYSFFFNSDLSGGVCIAQDRDGLSYTQMIIPGDVLLEFVGDFVGSELVGQIEQMSGREILDRLRH